MAAKYIWRVQNRRGWGPYNAHNDLLRENKAAPWMDDPTAFPEVAEEFSREKEEIAALCLTLGAVHGFFTRAQARAWFSAVELARLQREGFFLVRYPVEFIIYGNATSRQVLAAPRGAFERAKNRNIEEILADVVAA